MNHTLSESQLEAMIKSAVNSSGPLPPDEKFSQLISALRELQERRKVERDTEPYGFTDGDRRGMIYKPEHSDRLSEPVPVYRHAQPAPVVPEEATPDSIEILASARRRDHAVFQWDEDQRNAAADSWNACRAAMLQELKKSAGTEATCRSNENVQAVEVQSLTSINPAPDLVSLQKKAESIIGNYPGIPDCWCRTCRPVVLNDMRFVVCPDCGNKRCPRANDHRNACTGSNEPGQEGSAYPAAPQEVTKGK